MIQDDNDYYYKIYNRKSVDGSCDFDDKDIVRLVQYFKKRGLTQKYEIVRYNRRVISFNRFSIFAYPDEWFYIRTWSVRMLETDFICDQFDGLIKFLDDLPEDVYL